MPNEQLVKTIKSRGYWTTVIRPLAYRKERIKALSECKKAIRDSQVTLRGWSFPHLFRNGDSISGLNYVEHGFESESRKEFWRFYQSGQFLHYASIREDWRVFDQALLKWQSVPADRPILDAFWALLAITQRYEFAARLAQKAEFAEGVDIELQLHRTLGRHLVSVDPRRDLWGEYVCQIPQITKSVDIAYPELLGRTRELALDHAIWTFERFNWDNPPRHVLVDAQLEILTRV